MPFSGDRLCFSITSGRCTLRKHGSVVTSAVIAATGVALFTSTRELLLEINRMNAVSVSRNSARAMVVKYTNRGSMQTSSLTCEVRSGIRQPRKKEEAHAEGELIGEWTDGMVLVTFGVLRLFGNDINCQMFEIYAVPEYSIEQSTPGT